MKSPGDVKDAVLVYYDFDNQEICAIPSPVKSNILCGDQKSEPQIWLTEIDNGMQICYKTDRNQ